MLSEVMKKGVHPGYTERRMEQAGRKEEAMGVQVKRPTSTLTRHHDDQKTDRHNRCFAKQHRTKIDNGPLCHFGGTVGCNVPMSQASMRVRGDVCQNEQDKKI